MPVRLEISPSPSLTVSWIREGHVSCKRGVEEVLKNFPDELGGLLVGNDWRVLRRRFGGGEGMSIVALAQKLAFEPGEDVVIRSRVGVHGQEVYQVIGSEKFVQLPYDRVKKDGYSLQLMKLERYQWVTALELGTIGKQVTAYADRYATFLLLAGLAATYAAKTPRDYVFLLYDPMTLSSVEESAEFALVIREVAKEALRKVVRELGEWNEEYITLRVVFNEEFIYRARSLELKSLGFRMVRIRREGGQSLKVYGDTPLTVFLERDIYQRREFLGRINNALSRLAAPLRSYLRGRDQSGDGYHAFRALKNMYMYYETGAPVFLAQYNREVHAMAEALPQGDARRRRKYLCAVL
uniref:NurA domain-containing protein n=1 Tax=Thermofilum pendens TaxID=2269 RepID=A0A7C4FBM7_THEPE